MSGMWTWQSHKTKIGNGGTGEGQRQNKDPESKPYFILKSKQIAKKILNLQITTMLQQVYTLIKQAMASWSIF